MKYIFLPLFIFLGIFGKAQNDVLINYPLGQHFYIGGERQMKVELIKIFKNLDLKPCENNDEKYKIAVLIETDASIKFIKDSDETNIQQNQCAYDISRKIIPELTRWNPAVIEGIRQPAIAEINVDPFFYYYSKDNPSDNVFKKPEYKRGAESFSYEVSRVFQKKMTEKYFSGLHFEILFKVDTNGNMRDFVISGKLEDDIKSDILSELSRIKGKWNPATFNGQPQTTTLRQSVSWVSY